MSIECHMIEFCPVYYQHGYDQCELMLSQGMCGIRQAKLGVLDRAADCDNTRKKRKVSAKDNRKRSGKYQR